MTIVSRILERGDLREHCRAGGRPGVEPRRRFDFSPRTVWDELVHSLAPMGYEDEHGFHYGFPPASNNLSD